MLFLFFFLRVFYAVINTLDKPVWVGIGVISRYVCGQISNEPINNWQKSRDKTARYIELNTEPSLYSTLNIEIALLR